MFDLSKKVDYGLELMIFLAKNKNGPVSLRKIAEERKLPFKYLEQVAGELRESGLIEAKEGRRGGYFLKKAAEKISVAEITRILEGPVTIGACSGCPQSAFCGQKDVWGEVGDKVREAMGNKMLKDLV